VRTGLPSAALACLIALAGLFAPVRPAQALSRAPLSVPSPTASAWAWGWNSVGQVGQAATGGGDAPNPKTARVADLGDAVQVAGGEDHSLALRADGTVLAWGVNVSGQLGSGEVDGQAHSAPTQVRGLDHVRAIAAGPSSQHSLALRDDGTVWAWGSNQYGQIGDGSTEDASLPRRVHGLAGIAAVAAGADHSLALGADGSVWAWGRNDRGQLGNGGSAPSAEPVRVTGLPPVAAIAGGSGHNLALGADGSVWAWGENDFGQLGIGSRTPIGEGLHAPAAVPGLGNVQALAAGGGHTLALKGDGTVWAWGLNANGQLGDGSLVDEDRPLRVTGLVGVAAIAAGGGHSLALLKDGTVRAWGFNYFGQVGDGTTRDSLAPVEVRGLSQVRAVAGGSLHTLALVSPTAE
jgi:alpha-tubulin suppressor-like RCC1 family protein